MSQVEPNHGSLTLSSIGFQTEAENKSKSNKGKSFGSPSENLKSKGKPFDTNEKKKKAFRVVEKQQMEFAPFAAKSFSELRLPHVLIERLEEKGFTVLTEVQSAAVPSILNNRDVIIQSYTGSGKTLAYLLPILSVVGLLRVKGYDGDENGKKLGIEVVIVAPSRELGMQIVREFEKVLGMDNIRVVQQLVGGANRTRQEDALKKNKPAIVVGTPVDELLSFNFREDMHRILEHVGRRSSAEPSSNSAKTGLQAKKIVPLETFSPSEPVTLSRSSPSSAMPSQAVVESLPPALKHYYCVTRLQHKFDLKDVVFKLEACGMKAVKLHGDLGKLARGLNVAGCDLVVNLDLPTDSIHYAHRAGRTGRLEGKLLVTEEEKTLSTSTS
ncbi:hypothetical protein V8G54_021122 [Vigna mungo]|uniref:RNA helicase n=1 Tax=Vigna mungo TaxID=3915 RepID=A0AAQ3NEY6_VIGMU